MNAKHKAIAKKVGDRFAKNAFAKEYKEKNEGRERHKEHAEHVKSLPSYLKRK